ncbi:MAG: hypothetical protein V3575_01465 [Candidatus Absconditabacteria bacterium]
MKKLLIMLSLISLVFLGGCKFLWWGSDDSQNQPVPKNTTKSSFDSVYVNFISSWENKVATLKKLNNIQHKNEKINFGIDFDIASPFAAGTGNLKLELDSKTSLPNDYATTHNLKDVLFEGIFKLNGKIKGIAQGQSIDANIDADLLMSLVGGKLYAKLNELTAQDANNPSTEMMLSSFAPFKGVWLELFEIPADQSSSQVMITNPDDIFNFINDVMRLTKENVIMKVLEEKMEGDTKVFVVTLDNDKFVELMKKINQLESLKKLNGGEVDQITPEQEAIMKDELSKLLVTLAVKVSDSEGTVVEIQKLSVNGAVDVTGTISDNKTSLVLNSVNDGVKVSVDIDKNGENYKSSFLVYQGSLEMINLAGDFDVKSNNGFYDLKGTLIAEGNGYNISTSLEYLSSEGAQLKLTSPEGAKKIEEIMGMGMMPVDGSQEIPMENYEFDESQIPMENFDISIPEIQE